MLSGFVMARTYERRMEQGLRAGTFLAMRWRRLWPMAALGVVLAFVVGAIWSRPEAGGWLALVGALLFLPYPAASLFPLNGPRWSLFAELVANVIHAAVLARLRQRGLIVLIAGLAGLLMVLIIPLDDWPYPGRLNSFVPGMVRVMLAYCLGIALWRGFGERPVVRLRLPVLGLTMAGMIYLGGLIDPVLFGPLFVLLVCPLLVLGGATCPVDGRAARWCSAAGTMSYPLYAIHTPLVMAAYYAGLPALAVLTLALGLVALWVAGLVWWQTLPVQQHPGPPLPS
jgi:peptidoglycan/LPS O-acetylase OafA/YrhL